MSQQNINLGNAGSQSGDTIRNAFDKCNDNFDELYDNHDPTLLEVKNSMVDLKGRKLKIDGDAGQSGQFLKTDGAGNVSWATASGGGGSATRKEWAFHNNTTYTKNGYLYFPSNHQNYYDMDGAAKFKMSDFSDTSKQINSSTFRIYYFKKMMDQYVPENFKVTKVQLTGRAQLASTSPSRYPDYAVWLIAWKQNRYDMTEFVPAGICRIWDSAKMSYANSDNRRIHTYSIKTSTAQGQYGTGSSGYYQRPVLELNANTYMQWTNVGPNVMASDSGVSGGGGYAGPSNLEHTSGDAVFEKGTLFTVGVNLYTTGSSTYGSSNNYFTFLIAVEKEYV